MSRSDVLSILLVLGACTITISLINLVAQNLTFLIVMGSSVAASTTFPLLMLAIYWRGLTAQGAIAAGVVGLISSVGLIVLSPAFWVKVLGFAQPVFPSDYPALVSMPLALAAAWLVSQATTSKATVAQPAQ